MRCAKTLLRLMSLQQASFAVEQQLTAVRRQAFALDELSLPVVLILLITMPRVCWGKPGNQ